MGRVVNSDGRYRFEEKAQDSRRRALAERIDVAEALLEQRRMAMELALEELELLRDEMACCVSGG